MKHILALSGQDILATQHVKRWHMVRTKRVQTLAEHNATVAMLALRIAGVWWGEAIHPTSALLILDHALTHDSHEVEFGDPPSPAVRVYPEAHAAAHASFWDRRGGNIDAPDPVNAVVVLADKLEALLFYLLEGEDPGIARGCENSVRRLLEHAPVTVGLWVSELVQSVKNRTFTPQPPGNPWPRDTP